MHSKCVKPPFQEYIVVLQCLMMKIKRDKFRGHTLFRLQIEPMKALSWGVGKLQTQLSTVKLIFLVSKLVIINN